MNKLLLVLVLVVVLGGGYVFMRSSTPGPIENTMPVIGTSGVEEMIVQDTAVNKITLDSFEFGYDQKTITVREGEMVELTLTNSGKMPHDWIVDAFAGAKTKQIKNGETDTITFVASKAGTYEFYCSVGQHRAQGMVGTLIVE